MHEFTLAHDMFLRFYNFQASIYNLLMEHERCGYTYEISDGFITDVIPREEVSE